MNDSIKINLLTHDLANKLTIMEFHLRQAQKALEDHPGHEKVINALKTLDTIKGLCCSYRQHEMTTFDLGEALAGILSRYREISGQCDLALKPGPKVMVNCDANLFENAIHNLILNAVTADASIFVVKFSATQLIIQDNGNGVSSEQMALMNKSLATSPFEGRGYGIKSIFYFAFMTQWNLLFKQHPSDSDFNSGVTVEFDF